MLENQFAIRNSCSFFITQSYNIHLNPTMTTAVQVSNLLAQAQALVSKSWEHGVFCEILIEVMNPELSIFAPNGVDPFPDEEIPKLGKGDIEKCAALKWASSNGVGMRQSVDLGSAELVKRRRGDGMENFASSSNSFLGLFSACDVFQRSESLLLNFLHIDAAGDPASLGIPALLIGTFNHDYHTAACRQANLLLTRVPRTSKGAISHRYDVAEAWSDFVYMVPPFLAYLSVSTGEIDYLNTALTQIHLYRDELRISEGQHTGQWRHIIGPQNQDKGAWASGCGWAAMGMARVLATVMKWRTTRDWKDEQAQLKGYILELLNGALASPRDPANMLLRNYLNDETYSGEAAGTAILAATAYRMAVLVPDDFGPDGFGDKYLAWADESRIAVEKCINENGLVAPVINPLRHLQREPLDGGSPEGQCFAALMFAAYSDYLAQPKRQ